MHHFLPFLKNPVNHLYEVSMYKLILCFVLGAISYKIAFEQNLLPKSWNRTVAASIKKSAQALCDKIVHK
jgi:hypothetical protein